MEGPTSYRGSRNRITCLTLQEHDDDNSRINKAKLYEDTSGNLTYSRHGYAYSVPFPCYYLLNYFGRNFTRVSSRLLFAYINFHHSTNKKLKLTSDEP